MILGVARKRPDAVAYTPSRATSSPRTESFAGIRPQDAPGFIAAQLVGPHAIEVMKEAGIDLGSHSSTSVEDVDPASVDVVLTLCADEVCPVFSDA